MRCNVLITAVSRRVPLVLAFKSAMRALGVSGAVVVTDVNPLSPAVHVADRAYRVPLSNDPRYLDAIAAVCTAEAITLIVPTIDDEIELFGAVRERFAAQGVHVAVSNTTTAAICNDKLATCEHLRAHGVAAAASWLPATVPAPPPLPLFVKPRVGRGSVGAFQAVTRQQLEFFSSYVDNPVLQELLIGPEFTIDLLCDFDGHPLSVVPRERVVIRAGVIDRGRTCRDAALIDLGLACAAVLPFVGAVNIQCRVVAGRPTVFEINPRFSGGIHLTIAAGRAVEPSIGSFVDDLWMTSYEASIFVDRARATTLAPCVPLTEVA
jgi:carbamoyl-phosphate synthase large subunit